MGQFTNVNYQSLLPSKTNPNKQKPEFMQVPANGYKAIMDIQLYIYGIEATVRHLTFKPSIAIHFASVALSSLLRHPVFHKS